MSLLERSSDLDARPTIALAPDGASSTCFLPFDMSAGSTCFLPAEPARRTRSASLEAAEPTAPWMSLSVVDTAILDRYR